MQKVLKVSEAASLALHITVLLAANPKELISTKDAAATLQVSEAHLSKVLQRLVKSGIVKSIRGPKGGFTLEKASNEISLLDVYEAIEGPFETSDCLLDTRICSNGCILGGLLDEINKAVKSYFSGTRLSDLTHVYRRLETNA